MKPCIAARRRPACIPHTHEAHLSHGALAEPGSQIQVPAGVHKDSSMVPPEDCHAGRCSRGAACLRGALLHGDALAEEGRLLQRVQHRPHHLQRRHAVRLHAGTCRLSTPLTTREVSWALSFTLICRLHQKMGHRPSAPRVPCTMLQLTNMLGPFLEAEQGRGAHHGSCGCQVGGQHGEQETIQAVWLLSQALRPEPYLYR